MFTAPIEKVETTHYELTTEEIKGLNIVYDLLIELRDGDFELAEYFNFSVADIQEALLSIENSDGLILKKVDDKFEIEPNY